MIIDLPKFIAKERPSWNELEKILDRCDSDIAWQMDLDEVRRIDFLYRKVASDLGRLATFSSEPNLVRHLGSLAARAYSEIHESRSKSGKIAVGRWLFRDFPGAFQRHVRMFKLSLLITVLGVLFGAGAILLDPQAKRAVMPFEHLEGDPGERVAREENPDEKSRLSGNYATFSGELMTHNIRVSLFAFALGSLWGVGTIFLLFYNGVILGAVIMDYLLAGQYAFLFGWLMPHGVIEIPAILIGGQAGFLLARTLIGWGNRQTLSTRMREVGHDLGFLIFGMSVMLVWAGIVEAFISQFHAPILPYALKISFGVVELLVLVWFLNRRPQPSST